MGPKNVSYRKRSNHQTSRCTFKYKHHVRQFPPWLAGLNLSLDAKRRLSQGLAVKDLALIGSVFYTEILKGGPMGNHEVAELEASEEARLAVEAMDYSEGEEDEMVEK